MKYNTMNNDEIILSLCARIRETRISLALTQQQLADRAQVGIATIKRIEKGGGLNLDTLISLLRALNKLHHRMQSYSSLKCVILTKVMKAVRAWGDYRYANRRPI